MWIEKYKHNFVKFSIQCSVALGRSNWLNSWSTTARYQQLHMNSREHIVKCLHFLNNWNGLSVVNFDIKPSSSFFCDNYCYFLNQHHLEQQLENFRFATPWSFLWKINGKGTTKGLIYFQHQVPSIFSTLTPEILKNSSTTNILCSPN